MVPLVQVAVAELTTLALVVLLLLMLMPPWAVSLPVPLRLPPAQVNNPLTVAPAVPVNVLPLTTSSFPSAAGAGAAVAAPHVQLAALHVDRAAARPGHAHVRFAAAQLADHGASIVLESGRRRAAGLVQGDAAAVQQHRPLVLEDRPVARRY